jgi:hypothetical protein
LAELKLFNVNRYVFHPKEFKQAGFTAAEIREGGYTVKECAEGGWTEREVIAAGYFIVFHQDDYNSQFSCVFDDY